MLPHIVSSFFKYSCDFMYNILCFFIPYPTPKQCDRVHLFSRVPFCDTHLTDRLQLSKRSQGRLYSTRSGSSLLLKSHLTYISLKTLDKWRRLSNPRCHLSQLPCKSLWFSLPPGAGGCAAFLSQQESSGVSRRDLLASSALAAAQFLFRSGLRARERCSGMNSSKTNGWAVVQLNC